VNEGKLEPRAKKCIFLGYAEGVKGYRLWCLDSKAPKFLISRDVTFDESAMLKENEPQPIKEPFKEVQTVKEKVDLEIPVTSVQPQPMQVDGPQATSDSDVSDDENDVEQPYSLARDRARREIQPPTRYGHSDFAYCLAVAEEVEFGEPSSYKEAIASSDAVKWKAAMEDEIHSLQKNQTWTLVEQPQGKKIVNCKWVFNKKDDAEGIRYKARLVAKGYSQVEGVDFNEVFSPVVKHTSIRVLLSLVAMKNYELEQLDVKTAFLHGDLEEQIYMQQPEGYRIVGKENHVCLLQKSLYGLKQSPRQWYKRFDAFMESIYFGRSQYDNCVYFKKLADGSYMYLLLYVDDMLIATLNKEEIKKVKEQLSSPFEMKELGPAKKILGMEIIRDRSIGKLYLSQKGFIEKVLDRFKMKDAKPVSTPLAGKLRLSRQLSPKTEKEMSYMSGVPYSSAVGSIMYLMVCTRPDIAHAVSVVSRYLSCPGRVHWEAVKWILRYLKGTANVHLEFGRSDANLMGYVDSYFMGDLDKRRSLTAYVFTLGGCAISWKATLQSTIALSTTEAEYMAVTEGVKEAIWLKGLLG